MTDLLIDVAFTVVIVVGGYLYRRYRPEVRYLLEKRGLLESRRRRQPVAVIDMTMEEALPLAFRIVPVEQEHGRVYRLLAEKPLLPAICGAVAALPLPLLAIAFKIEICGYGLGTDYSGLVIVPLAALVTGAVGVLFGVLGLGLGNLLEKFGGLKAGKVIGTVAACVAAIALSLYLSVLLAGMLLFPDC